MLKFDVTSDGRSEAAGDWGIHQSQFLALMNPFFNLSSVSCLGLTIWWHLGSWYPRKTKIVGSSGLNYWASAPEDASNVTKKDWGKIWGILYATDIIMLIFGGHSNWRSCVNHGFNNPDTQNYVMWKFPFEHLSPLTSQFVQLHDPLSSPRNVMLSFVSVETTVYTYLV